MYKTVAVLLFAYVAVACGFVVPYDAATSQATYSQATPYPTATYQTNQYPSGGYQSGGYSSGAYQPVPVQYQSAHIQAPVALLLTALPYGQQGGSFGSYGPHTLPYGQHNGGAVPAY